MSRQSTSPTRIAVICHALYLANLLLLPAIAFVILLYLLFFTQVQPRWVKFHLIRAIQLSLLAGVVLILIPLLVLVVSPQFEASLMVMIFYFITLHSVFVLIGMFNLARAMVKKLPIF
jgi:ABC-type transport system involved in multi-copper enzyme maturation permease subunit